MKGGFFVAKQEDISKFNTSNAAAGGGAASVSGEDFFVDQLLNLDGDNTTEEEKDDNGVLLGVKNEPFEENRPSNTQKASVFLSPPPLEIDRAKDDFGSVLSVPAEEADLEWLSQFVEESFSTFSTPYPAGLGPISEKPKPRPEPDPGAQKARGFTTPVALSKARRSKRTRTGCRVWSSTLAEPASSSSSTTSSSPSSPDPDHIPAKKQRKRETASGSGGGPPRRCSHCGVQKTPQWRTGPLGAKTLCNACGVRYKSGRLLPEYRPACSPTFSSELHSNSHRKVLEMRKKKEMKMAGQPESSLAHPVPSFG